MERTSQLRARWTGSALATLLLAATASSAAQQQSPPDLLPNAPGYESTGNEALGNNAGYEPQGREAGIFKPSGPQLAGGDFGEAPALELPGISLSLQVPARTELRVDDLEIVPKLDGLPQNSGNFTTTDPSLGFSKLPR